MKVNPYPTPFIGFEGIDGSGQTTQAHLLEKALQKLSLDVLYTKGPTKLSDAGKKIHEVLERRLQMGHAELQKLFMEDHGERLKREIIPALEKETWVITDRYVFSGFAYATAEGVDINPILKMTDSFLSPNLIFYLSISLKEATTRIQKRGETLQTLYENAESLKKNKAAYEKILPQFPGFNMINGEQTIENVHQEIFYIVKQKFSL